MWVGVWFGEFISRELILKACVCERERVRGRGDEGVCVGVCFGDRKKREGECEGRTVCSASLHFPHCSQKAVIICLVISFCDLMRWCYPSTADSCYHYTILFSTHIPVLLTDTLPLQMAGRCYLLQTCTNCLQIVQFKLRD